MYIRNFVDSGELMREKLLRFMQGRNGNDAFNRFLLGLELVLLLISFLLRGFAARLFNALFLLLLVYIYYRMFSRDLYKRSTENAWYWEKRNRVLGKFRLLKERWLQRKDFRFFSCPSCHTTLRVPKGRGKIKIVCRKCGTSLTGKS
jgi:hypothetical protein